jgi:hypothetical protein
MSWSLLGTSSPAGHLFVAVVPDPARDRMLVYGGNAGTTCPSPVLWEFALATATWSSIEAPGGPGRLTAAFGVLDAARDRLVLFGGSQVLSCTGPATPSTDVWALSLGALQWQKLVPDGAPPPFVATFTALYDAPRDRMVTVGRDNSQANLCFALQWGPLVSTPAAPPRSTASAIRWVAPNPGRGVQTIELEIASGDRARRLSIVDLAGRVVWSTPLATANPGSARVTWDGRTLRGARARAGIYWVALEGEHGVTARRVLRIP